MCLPGSRGTGSWKPEPGSSNAVPFICPFADFAFHPFTTINHSGVHEKQCPLSLLDKPTDLRTLLGTSETLDFGFIL